MTRYRATLAYDGTNYKGYQRQAEGLITIQSMVESAIERVSGQPTVIHGAGRTDAGVHAVGQVIAFDLEWKHTHYALRKALNAALPVDIAILDIQQAEGFHPRFDAKSRVYQYTVWHSPVRNPLLANRTWHIYGDMDFDALHQTAHLLVGKHDFATFGHPPSGSNTVRELFRSEWSISDERYGERIVYIVEGTAFLRHMVRRIVGMMISASLHQVSVDEFATAFQQADIRCTGQLAPPSGLVLEAVHY